MKVLQVSKFYPPVHGGIEQVAFDISEGITKDEVKPVDVLCVDPFGRREGDEKFKYKVYRQKLLVQLFSTPLSLSFITRWRSIRNQYDVIHVHLPNPLAVLALFLFPPKGKIILHWHSDIVKQKKLLMFFYPLQKWILDRCEKIIVTSPIYGQSSPTLQHYQNKITCIPIGVDTQCMPLNEKLEHDIRERYKNKKIVFSLGRLVYYKGMEYLIDAARALPQDYVILIGGTGPLIDTLKDKVTKENLSSKVILLGSINYSDLASYYKACDVFCLPSIHESEAFGVVQLEAMSFSKPLVSTSIPRSGVAWVNQHNETGIVVKPNDAQALAKGIVTVIERHQEYSEGAKARFDTMFTKELMVKNIINLYSTLK
ncbi:glycosyl transferase family 1 [Cedecea neteri]|uniref:Glycosyl transferase family 1 n=1 Tax=Cedecea neteri TaxID=158822 RepID=A0AAN0S7G1_9ENTR|nr:glycosyltransferase [Cedecea neteri]AIR62963.1 glycosyl transferase family 1 [Cedecea neteri]